MNYKKFLILTAALIVSTLVVLGCARSSASVQSDASAIAAIDNTSRKSASSEKTSAAAASSDDLFNGEKIVKTADEWRKILTKEQFYILREQGTERAYTGEYNDNHEHGDYYCAACHLKLFSSKAKFESGTGWPSFYQPIAAANVTVAKDDSLGMSRDEVICSRCHSHLGHVFDDGPKPTGLRYCMNSVALKFEKGK